MNKKIARFKILWLAPFLLGILLISGCSSTRSLSSAERSSIGTVCVELDCDDSFEFFEETGAVVDVSGEIVFDSILNKSKSYMSEKGYRLTNDPKQADTLLVIRPNKGFLFKDGRYTKGVGFWVENGKVFAFAGFSVHLIDHQTGKIKACAHEGIARRVYGLQYYPSSWDRFSPKDAEFMMTKLIETGFASFYVSANKARL